MARLFVASEDMANGVAQREFWLEIRTVEHVGDAMQIASGENSVLGRNARARMQTHHSTTQKKEYETWCGADLGHAEQRTNDPAMQPFESKPAEIALALAERHPEPTHGSHPAQSERRAARAEPHEHRLDLVIRVVSRREDVHAPADHRVEHQPIARGARDRLDGIAAAATATLSCARAGRKRRRAPGDA